MSVLLFLSVSLCLVYADESKRLVLHSDTDIANQIMSMKNQLDTQMLEIRDLKSNINALVTENSEMRKKLVTLESAGRMYLYSCFSLTLSCLLQLQTENSMFYIKKRFLIVLQ